MQTLSMYVKPSVMHDGDEETSVSKLLRLIEVQARADGRYEAAFQAASKAEERCFSAYGSPEFPEYVEQLREAMDRLNRARKFRALICEKGTI